MEKSRRITITVLLTLFVLAVFSAVITLTNTKTTGMADGFNSSSWYNYNDVLLSPTVNGDVSTGNGQMYSTAKYPVTYDSSANTMIVTVEFSIVKSTNSTHQWQPMITYNAIENYATYQNKLGTVDDFLGFKCVYGNSSDYESGRIQFGACAGNGSWKNAYYTTDDPFSPTDGAKHTLCFIMDVNGIYAKLDENIIVAANTSNPYYFLKGDSSRYTISDFLDNGVPSVYFAIDNAYSYQTTIYKPAEVIEPVAFKATRWNNWRGNASFSVDGEGKMTVTAANYYKDALTEVNYDAVASTMKVSVDFSVNAENQTAQHFLPFITAGEITDWTESLGRVGHPDVVPTIGLRLYYASDWRWNNNSTFVRICDYANYSTNNYATMNPTDGETHNITFVMTSTDVTVQFDGVTLTANGSSSAYQCKKNSETLYTISDFIVNDTPSVYFGVMANDAYGTVKIHNNSFTNSEFIDALEDSLVTAGASIRLNVPTGLRFESSVAPAYYDYLAGIIGEENIETGTLLLPTTLLGGGDLTVNTEHVLRGTRTIWFNESARSFYATLINIPEIDYSKNISARAYMTFTWNATTYYLYSDVIERSVEQVAIAALDAYDHDTVAGPSSPETRDDANGFVNLVTMDGGVSYVYSLYTQDQVNTLLTFAQGGT